MAGDQTIPVSTLVQARERALRDFRAATEAIQREFEEAVGDSATLELSIVKHGVQDVEGRIMLTRYEIQAQVVLK